MFDMTSLGFKLPAVYAERKLDNDRACGMGLQLSSTMEGPNLGLGRLIGLVVTAAVAFQR